MGLPVLEEKIVKSFSNYGHDGNFGHVTKTIFTNYVFPLPKKVPY